MPEVSPIKGDLFLITYLDPWYGDILVYLQNLKCPTSTSHDEHLRIRHQARNYLILDDTLYFRGVDCIFHQCLIHEEAELVINDCHTGACSGHFSGLATAQMTLQVGYFWPTLIKDFIESVKKCHPCQIFSRKMRAHPTPMFPIIVGGPFTRWGIHFTTCHLDSTKGNHYIIVAIDYFKKWVEAMPTFNNDGETRTLFIFNQIVARFGIPKDIVTDHGSHFQNKMMSE
jgi:hypothetical protein